MSDLKPKPVLIELGGKEFGLLFSLNAIDDIQERFDIPISELGDFMRDERTAIRAVRTLLTILINEWIDDAENDEKHVDERWVGRKITVDRIGELKDAIYSSFADSLPDSEDDPGNPPTDPENSP